MHGFDLGVIVDHDRYTLIASKLIRLFVKMFKMFKNGQRKNLKLII